MKILCNVDVLRDKYYSAELDLEDIAVVDNDLFEMEIRAEDMEVGFNQLLINDFVQNKKIVTKPSVKRADDICRP